MQVIGFQDSRVKGFGQSWSSQLIFLSLFGELDMREREISLPGLTD